MKKWDIISNGAEYAIFDGFGFFCGYATKEEAEKARREIIMQKHELDGITDPETLKYIQ